MTPTIASNNGLRDNICMIRRGSARTPVMPHRHRVGHEASQVASISPPSTSPSTAVTHIHQHSHSYLLTAAPEDEEFTSPVLTATQEHEE